MEETIGVLWVLQIIVGPLVLAAALAYGAFNWRRRRLQGEGRYSTADMFKLGLPVLAAAIFLVVLMMIPGSR